MSASSAAGNSNYFLSRVSIGALYSSGNYALYVAGNSLTNNLNGTVSYLEGNTTLHVTVTGTSGLSPYLRSDFALESSNIFVNANIV